MLANSWMNCKRIIRGCQDFALVIFSLNTISCITIWNEKNCNTVTATGKEYLHHRGCVDFFLLDRTHTQTHNSVT